VWALLLKARQQGGSRAAEAAHPTARVGLAPEAPEVAPSRRSIVTGTPPVCPDVCRRALCYRVWLQQLLDWCPCHASSVKCCSSSSPMGAFPPSRVVGTPFAANSLSRGLTCDPVLHVGAGWG
jgi:hypothetical protein